MTSGFNVGAADAVMGIAAHAEIRIAAAMHNARRCLFTVAADYSSACRVWLVITY